MSTLKTIGVAIAGIVVGYVLAATGVAHFGGIYSQVAQYFPQGLYAGTSNQLSVDTSGNITTSGTASISGAATVNGLVTLNGGALHSAVNSTSTTATSEAITASDITNYESVVMIPNTGLLTVTLPASSTLSSFIPVAGDFAEQCWTNATGTASVRIAFAGGTGTNLLVASSSATALGSSNIGAGKTGCFKFFRIGAGANANDINAIFTAYQ